MSVNSENAIETKLGAARTKLILDKPFLGALVLRLPMVKAKADWCPTTFTDAKKIYYNAEYIDTISAEHVQFVMAREALHCGLSHFARRGHRIKHLWEMACEFAINPILVAEGLIPPADVIVMQQYGDMAAEEIYPLLEENENNSDRDLTDNEKDDSSEDGKKDQAKNNQGKNNEKGKGGGKADNDNEDKDQDQGASGKQEQPSSTGGGTRTDQPELDGGAAEQPEALSEAERESLNILWQQRLAGAAQQAMTAGKLGDSMMRLVDFMLQPKLPWRSLLSQYMSAIARDDYSYSRPSSRRGDPALFPSLRSAQLNITVALDISGSIKNKEINEFVSEIDAIKGTVRARIVLLACDAEMAEGAPWEFEPWEEFAVNMKLKGGGGTKFTPVFDWLNKQDSTPDLLVYFTDAVGEFPQAEPNYPVIWLVKGKAKVPFGQRIQLN
ncbi:MAG: VWA-like domain-containing protein [Gammaproteobacteria bacterium]|nr:VWA-like domain-containing protein [Gammaproteobacteria bacterium]